MQIIYQDQNLIVIDKPAGLPSIPNFQTPKGGSVVGQLEEKLGIKLWVVHRLDKDTSGLMVFAKDASSHRALNRLFETGQADKIYYGIIRGKLEKEERLIDLPIAKKDLLRMKVSPAGQPARTRIRMIESFRDFSLLEIVPLTGKKHQIRLHLQAIGHPLAIDPYYGSDEPILLSTIKKRYKKKADEEEIPVLKRLPLHAWRLKFKRPLDGKELDLEAPLPKDLAYLIKVLRKYDR